VKTTLDIISFVIELYKHINASVGSNLSYFIGPDDEVFKSSKSKLEKPLITLPLLSISNKQFVAPSAFSILIEDYD
jgi:hypothetical protein